MLAKKLWQLVITLKFSLTLAPSCYLNTGCTGNPIGTINTNFSECCNLLSGRAFALGRQCRVCPTTGI